MKSITINSTKDSYFNEAWELYQSAFPVQERRELSIQKEIFIHLDYHFDVFLTNKEFIGFIAWWQFDGLRFIEHFATHEKSRGKGYGKSILEKFLSEHDEVTILEVELPTSDINQRRIDFYSRLGFKLNKYEYYQLPLRKNGLKLKLQVMSFPSLINQIKLDKFENEFKIKCYDRYII